jgi:gamma-glutamylcysteine synthetase
VLAVTFFGSVFLLQQVLRSLIGGPNEFAVAVAALVNGLLFQPVRRRIQQVLDRRVRRRTYDKARALTAFQASLRADELQVDDLARRLLATIRDVLHPIRLGLWLRDRDHV